MKRRGEIYCPTNDRRHTRTGSFIEQVAIIADTRKFVSALIVPSFESLEEYARSINLKYHDRLELLRHSHIVTCLSNG